LRSKMPPASARANSALFILLILCFLSALGCSDSSLPIRFAGHVARVVMERPRLLFARAIGSRRLEGAIEQVRSDGGRLPLTQIGRQTPSARTCFEGLQPHQLLLACFILIFLSRTVLAPPRRGFPFWRAQPIGAPELLWCGRTREPSANVTRPLKPRPSDSRRGGAFSCNRSTFIPIHVCPRGCWRGRGAHCSTAQNTLRVRLHACR
jgi:hypothetical protein